MRSKGKLSDDPALHRYTNFNIDVQRNDSTKFLNKTLKNFTPCQANHRGQNPAPRNVQHTIWVKVFYSDAKHERKWDLTRCAASYAFDWSFLETALGPHNKLVNKYPIVGLSLDQS